MATALTGAICIIQIILLIALGARDLFARRRQIVAALRHKGWVASTRGLAPMHREPAFGGNGGAIVYLLPERDGFKSAPQQRAA